MNDRNANFIVHAKRHDNDAAKQAVFYIRADDSVAAANEARLRLIALRGEREVREEYSRFVAYRRAS